MNSVLIFFQIQSTIILCLMIYGIYHRHHRSKHVKTMITSIVWDFILVLQIELNLDTLTKAATKAGTSSIMINTHIFLAVATMVGYLILLFLGRKLLKGAEQWRKLHRNVGIATFVLRIWVAITSIMIIPTPKL